MSLEEKIDKIDKVKGAAKTVDGGIDEVQDLDRLPPNKDHFDTLVNNPNKEQQSTRTNVAEKVEPVTKSSLMDEVRNLNLKVDHFSRVTPKDLVAQADEVVKQIDTIKTKLKTPDLELKPATQNLLQNKLSHIDENLRVALSKAGLEYNPTAHLDNKTVNPIERFLGFLTNGQTQLASLGNEINQMHLNNKEISPANMLRIQMKVGYITQEVEFFTAVLNKALESTKTIMNVQV
ncbi:MAG TPA: hypothetical protein VGP47_10270 [Parachlamydiaceae bacterium]|nr:hypothetical protein [Parachlamydiaceae bacterium]